MKNLWNHFSVTKTQRNGFLFLCFILIILGVFTEVYPYFKKENESKPIPKEILAFANKKSEPKKQKKIIYSRFNPNQLDIAGFEALGFTTKQAVTIIKFRKSLGGRFNSAEQFFKCYVISDKKASELKPYVQIDEVKKDNFKPKKQQNKPKFTDFDPNDLDLKGWVSLGFSEKQAQIILKYKNKVLKGRFSKPTDLQKCYVVSDFKFSQLMPYIKIKKNTPNIKPLKKENKVLFINQISKKDWIKLGFNEAEAENILKFREFIGGFNSKEDVLKCTMVAPDKLLKISKEFILKFDKDSE